MYDRQGADEVTFLDITATHEGRGTVVEVVRPDGSQCLCPSHSGRGYPHHRGLSGNSRAGADKVSVNSAAVKNPQLIAQAADRFGSQCVVVAMDVKQMEDGSYHIYVSGGRIDTGVDALWWAKEAERLGAGEILLTSMDTDGCKKGFDLPLTKKVAELVNIPVIASGGCGTLEHFSDLFEQTGADAALAASLFHYGELTVGQVKEHLRQRKIPVRV